MYKIVYAENPHLSDAVKEVETEVFRLKNAGWTKQGGVSVSRPEIGINVKYSVAQAMVKKYNYPPV